jgi:CheY-like chemotaxis protein
MATILIVDDHPANRTFLRTLLGYKGHRLVEAADGAEGLAVAGAERPDLVITDILMPTMDGYEFVHHLHADPAFAHIPVVFWSAHYLEREARTLAQSCNVSHVLIKPCEPEEVLRTVDAALSHAAAPTTAPSEAAQLAVAYENARLYTKLERRTAALEQEVTQHQLTEARLRQQLARLALLHQITRAIGTPQDLYSIFLVVLRYLEQELPLAFGCLCLGSLESDTLTVTAVEPASQVFAATVGLEEQAVLSLSQNGLQACIKGQTVSIQDTAQEPSPLLQYLARADLRSLVATPLLVEGGVFGLLLAARRDVQAFSSDEVEFLRQLSEYVALAAHQAQLYTKLQQAYDDLQQSWQIVMQQERLQALGQMASGIAHDINNALSPVALYIESVLVGEPTLSTRAQGYLTTVQQAVHDIAHTVARLREFYRQPAVPQEAQLVALNQMVQEVVELTRAKWRDEPQQRGLTIAVHTVLQEQGMPLLLGVESELREALINLVLNAVDAMPQGGILTLQTRAMTTAVLLEVRDTGIGMDEVTRQRCLEPFYTTKGERGTGLGLAIVHGVLERHAAQLTIESAVGHGTTMRLLFPRAPSNSTTGPQCAEGEAMPPHLRILVIDDDPLVRQALQDALQSEGHAVTVAEGGEAGLEAVRAAQARQEPFAVVMTDLGMPGMDGREVARAVKHAAPETPVVLLTGWGQALQQDGSILPHVDYLLSKPPRRRELQAALVAVTESRGRRTDHGTD